MMRYTVSDIMSEGPCEEYPVERVEALWAGRESLSPRQIAELDIPILDRIWILGRLLCRLSLMRAHRITRMIALDVADLWPCPNIAWWYLASGDKNSRAAAEADARGAPWAASTASWYAARDAAIDASYNAAREASWSARDGKDAARERYLGWLVRFGWEV
jgi:hypothetical protein